MNRIILNNWNNKVRSIDTTYILGDIFPCAGGDAETVLKLIKRLKGNKILIIGNYDEPFLLEIEKSKTFNEIGHIFQITDNNREVTLCHYPLMSWQNDDKGSIHLYGHIHNKELPDIKGYYKKKEAYNAGCDIFHLNRYV